MAVGCMFFSVVVMYGSSNPELSTMQIELLAGEIVNHTPEHLHWVEGTQFSWVLFPLSANETENRLRTTVLGYLKKKYTVYERKADIPAGHIADNGKGKNYSNGFFFQYRLQFLDNNRIQIQYVDYESPLAASFQTLTYQWDSIRWKVIEQGPLFVS